MGIELPAELADVAAAAGVRWPRADEDAMREQARAWRTAASRISGLSRDADGVAREAAGAIDGDAARAARQHWEEFVAPDTGHLSAVARDCHAAADRLEHAADQVGAAKVEMVRQLVGLARNRDAAEQAASAGHPHALLGLDTAVRGTATNVAALHDVLTRAVQPGSGVSVADLALPVSPHGQGAAGGAPGLVEGLVGGGERVLHQTLDSAQGAVAGSADTAVGVTDTALGAARGAAGGAVELGVGAARTGADAVTQGAAHGLHGLDQARGSLGPVPGPADDLSLGDEQGPGRGRGPADLRRIDPDSTGPVPGVAAVVRGVDQRVGEVAGALGPHATDGPATRPGEPGLGGGPGPGGGHGPGGGPGLGGGHGGGNRLGEGPPASAPVETPAVVGQAWANVSAGVPAQAVVPPVDLAPAGPAGGAVPPGGPAQGVPVGPPGAALGPVAGGGLGGVGSVGGAGLGGGAVPSGVGAGAGAGAGAQPGGLGAGQQPAGGVVGGNPPAAGQRPGGAPLPVQQPAQPGQQRPPVPVDRPGVPVERPGLPAERPGVDLRQVGRPPAFTAPAVPAPAPGPTPPLISANAQPSPGAPSPQQPAVGQASPGRPPVGGHHPGVPQPGVGGPPVPGAPANPPHAGVPHSGGDSPAGPGAPAGPYGLAAGPGAPFGSVPGPAVPYPGQPWELAPHAPPAATDGPPTRPGRRDEQVMAFYLHMFPIGHMPKVATRPARQLRAPASEADFASGLRFAPQDHPMAGMVEDAEALRRTRAGDVAPRPGSGVPFDHPDVQALTADYEPLGDVSDRDWPRRFLVRPADPANGRQAEYNWPPSEMFPEGGLEPGEPWVVDEGAVLDRFGGPEGRVLAEAGTPFRFRCLPPEHLHRGYHRYRVLRALPVWRATAAPWFGQPGGGDRYRATYPVAELVAMGYLEEIAPEGPGEGATPGGGQDDVRGQGERGDAPAPGGRGVATEGQT